MSFFSVQVIFTGSDTKNPFEILIGEGKICKSVVAVFKGEFEVAKEEPFEAEKSHTMQTWMARKFNISAKDCCPIVN